MRGLFQENESHFYPPNSLARKGPHLKIGPITRFFLTAAGFTAQILITPTKRELLTETRIKGRPGRECSWAGHFRSRRAVRAAAAICNPGRASSAALAARAGPLLCPSHGVINVQLARRSAPKRNRQS